MSLFNIDTLSPVLSTIPTQQRPIHLRYQILFVPLQDSDSGKSMFVQSLRGDPFRVKLICD